MSKKFEMSFDVADLPAFVNQNTDLILEKINETTMIGLVEQVVDQQGSFALNTLTNTIYKLFDAYTDIRQKGRGNATNILMSFKHLGSVMKILEAQKGPYVVTKSPSASLYGWTEIEITTVRGAVKIVGIYEMDNDVIFLVDLKSMTFRTRGGFKKRVSPEGKEYFGVLSFQI
jgi:hypothetical protein